MLTKQEAMQGLDTGKYKLEQVLLQVGDVMIRDVRHIHRGTPNRTNEPRPMVVIGYSRRWLFRPEVGVQIPRPEWQKLSDQAKKLLRYATITETLVKAGEKYQSFAH